MAEVISFLTLIPTAVGIAIGLALIVVSLARGLALQPDTITPSKYLLERVKAKPVKTGQFEPDTAWPFYPLRQLRADLLTIGSELLELYPPLWNWPVDTFFLGENGSAWGWWIFLPLPIAVFIALITTGVTMVALYALFAAVAAVSAAVILAGYGAIALLLREGEGAWQTVMHAQASCPHPQCYLVTPRPAYKCFRCGELHRDIRPGRARAVRPPLQVRCPASHDGAARRLAARGRMPAMRRAIAARCCCPARHENTDLRRHVSRQDPLSVRSARQPRRSDQGSWHRAQLPGRDLKACCSSRLQPDQVGARDG